MTPAFNVLFLCTRNSGRSIMAEAILEQARRRQVQRLLGRIRPGRRARCREVLEKLRALGHDVSDLRSKSWNEFTGPDAPHMDFVIALCDTLDGQVCPDFGDKAVTGAWPLPDPAKFGGSPADGRPCSTNSTPACTGGSASSSACRSPRSTAWRQERGWTRSAPGRSPLGARSR